MKRYAYQPRNVCPVEINFNLDGDVVSDISFTGGCNGNTKAVAKLVTGRPVDDVVELLAGNDCGGRGTSCADQLTLALRQAQEQARALA